MNSLEEKLIRLKSLASDMGVNLHVVSTMAYKDEIKPTTVRKILGIDVITSPLSYGSYFRFLEIYRRASGISSEEEE